MYESEDYGSMNDPRDRQNPQQYQQNYHQYQPGQRRGAPRHNGHNSQEQYQNRRPNSNNYSNNNNNNNNASDNPAPSQNNIPMDQRSRNGYKNGRTSNWRNHNSNNTRMPINNDADNNQSDDYRTEDSSSRYPQNSQRPYNYPQNNRRQQNINYSNNRQNNQQSGYRNTQENLNTRPMNQYVGNNRNDEAMEPRPQQGRRGQQGDQSSRQNGENLNTNYPNRRQQFGNTNNGTQSVRQTTQSFGRMGLKGGRGTQVRSNLNSRPTRIDTNDDLSPNDNGEEAVKEDGKPENGLLKPYNRNSDRVPVSNADDDPESQRSIMDDALRRQEYECMVCCEIIGQPDRTWNCDNCFNMFHLNCIKSWAQSLQVPKDGQQGLNRGRNHRRNNMQHNDWRCPICQAVQKKMPNTYLCYCTKRRDPELSRYLVPHSCGDPCGRQLNAFNTPDGDEDQYFSCPHKCTSLCHPGKCAPCKLKMERTCACKQTKMYLNCVSKKSLLECENSCDKLLNCGEHRCERRCHFGDCRPCERKFDIKCFCGNTVRERETCAPNLEKYFTCESICGKKLACGNHFCKDVCHPGPCGECQLLPKHVKTCNCGQTKIVDLKRVTRRSCLDPIPVCGKVCQKALVCGSEQSPHTCESKCHAGKCPTCPKSSIIKCECGANSQKLDCKEMTGWRFKCKRRCNKKLQCGRHKCLNECCTLQDHVCQQVCGKKLACGIHNCAESCHNYCQPCPNVIWEEIFCNCGAEVLYPPQPCNTPRPQCKRPCSRPHPCGHRQRHECHDDDTCPPCVEMVSRRCVGDHEEVQNVYCHQTNPSCGRQCSKQLPCEMHKCVKGCHAGDCSQCNQRCTAIREACEHVCGMPCHAQSNPNCPKSNCIESVKVHCDCKFRSEVKPCYLVRDPKRFQSLFEVMTKRFQFNTEMNFDVIRSMVNDKLINCLDCDEECTRNKRTIQLAEAFGIAPKDVLQEAKYTEFLRNEARSNPEFIDLVHEKCVSLINEFKKKNVRQLSYNFTPMSRVNRQIVHQYAESMGLKTESIDQEPNRSVMIKATKLSVIPTRSLLQVMNIDIKKLVKPKEYIVTAKTASEEQAMRKKPVIDYFND